MSLALGLGVLEKPSNKKSYFDFFNRNIRSLVRIWH